MKLFKRIVLCVAALVLLIGLGYGAYYVSHYFMYKEYKNYLSEYEIKEGTEFTAKKEATSSVPGDGWALVDESDSLKLYINTNTTAVAVYDKRSGEITYSNPQEEDKIAQGVNKQIMDSQLVIYYLDRSNTPVTKGYNTAEYAVQYGQFNLVSLEDGIRVEYELGDFTNSSIIPLMLTKERYEELVAAIPSNMKFKAYYTESKTNPGIMEISGGKQPGASVARKMTEALESIGYTEADYEADMEAAGAEASVPVSFTACIEYRLDGDSLVMNVPTKNMTETAGAQIYKMEVMNYFGAASSTENGYMVVPNGSGSIINFNNGKSSVDSYMQYFYGMDVLASATQTTIEHTVKAAMPIYGLVKDNSAVLAIVENGEALGSVTASVAGKFSGYNNVFSTFTLRSYEQIEMDGGNMTVIQPKINDVNIQIRYCFMDQNKYDYVGLAEYYRNYLIGKGELVDAEIASGDIPFYMDVIGGVKETAFILGVQYLNVEPMTTYKEANTMLDTLNDSGIDRVVMNYKGWFNGGYYHSVADQINLVNKLGSKKELEQLSARLEADGGKLYGDVAFQEVTSISKRYKVPTESSRYYGNGHVALQGRINPTTFRSTSGWGYDEVQNYLISPRFLPRYTGAFSNKITNYDITGVSLRDLASDLQSDNKRTEMINRAEALEVVKASLEQLDGSEKDIMEESANAYGWKYADDLLNVPMEDNDFFIIDKSIPFYQMVVHGCISYACDPINLSSDYDKQAIILDCIETGSAPHFTFTYEEAAEMKYTGVNNVYSSTFANWTEDATEIYKAINEALSLVSDATITGHEVVDNVTIVTYSNGVKIYINRNAEQKTVDGFAISGNSYEVGGVK